MNTMKNYLSTKKFRKVTTFLTEMSSLKKRLKFDASTVSGWIIEYLGEIPSVGKEFEYSGYIFKVLKSTVKKVLEVSAFRLKTSQ